jgi:serine/threonine protein kinase
MRTEVQRFCNRLLQSHLLSLRDVRYLLKRWHKDVRGAEAPQEFSRWLVAGHYLTGFQVGRLLRGHSDRLCFDGYKVLDHLGQGALTRVYKAVGDDDRVVALKVLPPRKAADPRWLARFECESRRAWRLHHPNVVRTYRTGEADGLHFAVLEYLDGETLEAVLRRRGRLPLAESIRLVYQACLGLQHIYERGLVHGNLEPANLMLVPRRQPGQPDTTLKATLKILDVGLGRAVLQESLQNALAKLCRTGQAVLHGSLDDVAPEQAGDMMAGDIRADVYSLGCILYHCLTGRPPFRRAGGLDQLIRHATEAPPPLAAFDRSIPAGVQQIIDTMLAKDPAQRYPTPERAARELAPYLLRWECPTRIDETCR